MVLAYCRETKEVVRVTVGGRTNKTIKRITKSLELSNAKKIYTDGLKNYKFLIKKRVHRVKQYCTNHVERVNLNLRTHLKRLNRRTLGFSKSILILESILKIYFWF